MADDVTFFFDPSCPFTWRTSRWLREVTAVRGHTIGWRLMSLVVLNEGKQIPEQYRARMEFSTRVLRVFSATLREHGGDGLDRLYTEFGDRYHYGDAAADDATVVAALAAAGLPAGLIDAADDASVDAAVRVTHDEGQARTGQESGSPITAVGDGPGFFGPIVVPPPAGEAAEKLYDLVRLAAAVPEFSELKRARAAF